MKTHYIMYVEGSRPGTEVSDYLLSVGAEREPDPDDPCAWRVPAAKRGSVKDELRRRAAPGIQFYAFSPDEGDDIDRLAAYTGADYRDAADIIRMNRKASDPIFVRDAYEFYLVVNRRMVEMLDPVTEGVTWRPYQNSDALYYLAAASELPDPIKVVEAREIVKLTNGEQWEVSGDGRSIITNRSLAQLSDFGIAYSSTVVVGDDDTVYPQKSFTVLSGRVIEVLRDFDDSPYYLVPEGLEVEEW